MTVQEDIDNKTVAVSVRAARLTARVLLKALAAAAREIQKAHQEAQTPQGRQPVKKLMNHRAATSSIPLDGDTKLFDRVARKFNVDYAFHETGPGKYLLLFKSGQADAVMAAFEEYSRLVLAQAKDRRLPVREQLERAAERVQERPQELQRVREVSHDER